MYKKLSILLFAILFLGMSIINVLKKDVVFSETENRYLQTFPQFNWDKFMSGEFGSEIETFSSDQFVFRDQWISLNTMSELSLGKKDNGRVYFGDQGWLYSLNDAFDQNRFEKNMSLLQEFNSKYGNQIDLQYVLVPSKYSIQSSTVPKNAPFKDEQELYWKMVQKLDSGAGIVDLFTVFKQQERDLYYRTDHHWNINGAFLAYEEIMKDRATSIDEYDLEMLSSSFYGTDYRKANAPFIKAEPFNMLLNDALKDAKISVEGVDEPVHLLQQEALLKQDKYAYFQGGNHGFVNLQGTANNDKSILIIKDSFANSLIPFLLPHYSSIDFIDLRHYNGSIETLIQDKAYDDIRFVYNIQTLSQDPMLSKLLK